MANGTNISGNIGEYGTKIFGRVSKASNLDGDVNLERKPNMSNAHDLLLNRDMPDQHPISAITGLEDTLA